MCKLFGEEMAHGSLASKEKNKWTARSERLETQVAALKRKKEGIDENRTAAYHKENTRVVEATTSVQKESSPGETGCTGMVKNSITGRCEQPSEVRVGYFSY